MGSQCARGLVQSFLWSRLRDVRCCFSLNWPVVSLVQNLGQAALAPLSARVVLVKARLWVFAVSVCTRPCTFILVLTLARCTLLFQSHLACCFPCTESWPSSACTAKCKSS